MQALDALGARRRAGQPGRVADDGRPAPALNALRRAPTLRRKLPLLLEPERGRRRLDAEDDMIPDDRLRLVFTCCHPALAREAQVALTLRLVCGVADRRTSPTRSWSPSRRWRPGSRARRRRSPPRGIPYACRPAGELPARLDAALTVIHLLYTTGHTAPSGDDLVRDDLAARALDLARMLHALLPRERRGRRAARAAAGHRGAPRDPHDADGRLLRLDEQDRTRWDRARDRRGRRADRRGAAGRPPGRFTLQAAIAALHAAGAELRRHRLAADPRALRRAAARLAVAGGRAQPRGRARRWSTGPRAALPEVDGAGARRPPRAATATFFRPMS